jgi:hypothetical protein
MTNDPLRQPPPTGFPHIAHFGGSAFAGRARAHDPSRPVGAPPWNVTRPRITPIAGVRITRSPLISSLVESQTHRGLQRRCVRSVECPAPALIENVRMVTLPDLRPPSRKLPSGATIQLPDEYDSLAESTTIAISTS